MSAADSDPSLTAPSSPLLPDNAGTGVDTDNPWLGLASFTEESRAFFFGREQEITELERRVQRKLLTVLFGKSGLGKTSILQAGLVPGLRARGYFPVYLRIDYGRDSPEPAEQIKQAINWAAAAREGTAHGMPAHAAPTIDPTESIWEFLHHRDEVRGDVSAETSAPPTPIPLLIFDQFEELFTLAQSDEFGRARAARFVEELADLVENRPPKALEAKLDTDDSIAERFDFARSDYRVVIALREDYLAPLESLKRQMPSLSQNRLRLAPMTGSQALEAVLQPGNRLRAGEPLVTEEVAEAIVRFVAGGSELANAEVEPSLLSLICRELNEQRVAQHRAEISQDLLAGSHESILSNFYERSLADQPESVRRIIEDDLLTESGYRENLAEESLLRRFQAAGAAPDALGKLVNRRLLRIEERLDIRRVELTHDVLTGVVKASRDQRHEREAREATQRTLAEQAARENAARRALRRARAIAAGCTLLALVAIAAAVAAFFSVQRARSAEQLARQTRATSEQARQEAEGLLGFLTDDFVRELETFGRVQTIAELSQREIDYFEHLPLQLEDPQTVRSGALALANHASALRFVGDLAAAGKDATAAIAQLERLQRSGNRSDATTVVLGRAYAGLGNIRSGENNEREATRDLQRAVDLLRPIAGRIGAPVDARRTYEEALVALGAEDWRSGKNEDGVRVEREAMRVALQLGARRQGDVTLDTDYASAESWLAGSLVLLGRDEEARRADEEALAVADQVLAKRPDYGAALLAKDGIGFGLAQVAADELDPAASLRFATQEQQTDLQLMRLEPRNRIYLNELGVAYSRSGAALWAVGRLREAIGDGRRSMDAFGQGSMGSGFLLQNLTLEMAFTAFGQAQLGDSAGVSATLAAADAFMSHQPAHVVGGGQAAAFFGALRAYPEATLAYERKDFDAVRHLTRTALAAWPNEGEANVVALCELSGLEGRAEYVSGDFAAAARSEHTAVQACKVAGHRVELITPRTEDRVAIWLSMALARDGKRQEAAQTIAPVVATYRGLVKRNHGDQWLPLELAEALYAQSLTDDAHRAALLREAAQRIDHLVPGIATLHDTQAWRARIEATAKRD
jgi:tetratricopeptide (TPR) repeat protein